MTQPESTSWCKRSGFVPSGVAALSSVLRAEWLHAAVLVGALALGAATVRADERSDCVQLFYDAAPDQSQRVRDFADIHRTFLSNLLGHFPHLQQILIPIEGYRAGDLDRCRASIYIGTNYFAAIPEVFLRDYVAAARPVLWAGYNIWRLGRDTLDTLWGVRFQGLTVLDHDHPDAVGRPGFFRIHEYKGERFTKHGDFDRNRPERFNAAFENVRFALRDDEATADHVIAWTEHDTTGERIPYLLRNGNHWYLTESPFAFAVEDGRYLIFADLLFDLLGESPRHPGVRPALFRIEDIHPQRKLWPLYRLVDLLDRKGVPFAMSIIPVYSDPLSMLEAKPKNRFVPLTANPRFLEFLRYARDRGATFIYHGVTHQHGTEPNPFNAVSGEDFEFWDAKRNRPVRDDSTERLIRRLEDGLSLLDKAGVHPAAWLTPHHQASPLDNVLFGQLFGWNIGRVIYFPRLSISLPRRLPAALTMTEAGAAGNGQRLEYVKDLDVDYPENLLPTGQFFPYEIFGDVYGQRIIPESVGNLQPFINEQVHKAQDVALLLERLRRNRVLRDVWGSFFVHPFILRDTVHGGLGRYPGDLAPINRLIDGAREAGYRFVDLARWIDKTPAEMRPELIHQSVSSAGGAAPIAANSEGTRP